MESEDAFLTQKSLPRLPSSDDAYNMFHGSSMPPGPHTSVHSITQGLPPPPPSTPYPSSPETDKAGPEDTIPTSDTTSQFSTISTATNASPKSMLDASVPAASIISSDSTSSTLPLTVSTATSASQPPTPPKDNSQQLLVALRHNFHQIEQSLYTQLAKTSDDSLNEVRSAFLSTGRGTQKRLTAWQRKHLGPKAKLVGELMAEEPVWWAKDCHVVPGGNIIVREADWGSIIAHTLRYSLFF